MLSAPAQHTDVDDTAQAVQAVQVQFHFWDFFSKRCLPTSPY